jgi:hypothetical protein
MGNQDPQITPAADACYYDVRLLIRHPSMRVDEISAVLGMDPNYAWNVGEAGRHETMWGHVSRTRGSRHFFKEVHGVLEWLHDERESVARLLSSGGTIQVIVQLPGGVNIGDSLRQETMVLASSLGVMLGIEVFPNLS